MSGLPGDATERRDAVSPDATERRPQADESTVRRKAADADATERRDPDPYATVRRPAVLQDVQDTASVSFPCSVNGQMLRLEVVRLMGEGGEGRLYLCTDGAGYFVAKVLERDSDYQILDAMIRRRAELETRHLVPCIWLGRMSDVYGTPFAAGRYIVHPYYEQGDMASLDNMRVINPSISYSGDESSFSPRAEEYLKIDSDYGQVDEQAFTDLVAQLADGLQVLHDTTLVDNSDGTMHRDIKPQNIFVASDGSYALGDFGLVSAMNAGVNQNFTERVGLSHGYSPPEAYSDPSFRQRVTRKYDYFSLGMTLLHIAGGRPRYIIDSSAGESDVHYTSLADYYEIIQSSSVDVPRELPERVRHIIQGLVAANSEVRWGAREVQRWLAGEDPPVPAGGRDSLSGISLYAEGRVQRGSAEVADALSRDWKRFAEELQHGELAIAWDSPDPAYQKAVEHVIANAQFQDPDIALQTLILTIAPGTGHVFGGRRYDTDDALGKAMLDAASSHDTDDEAFFTDMLKKGALSNAWRMSAAGRNERMQRAVLQIEEGAKTHPHAALYAAGALLSGRRIDPVTIPTKAAPITFSSAQHLFEWVKDKFGDAVRRYADVDIAADEPPDIPGCWTLGDNTACVRQVDGSLLINSGSVLGTLPVSGELLAVAEFALNPSDDPESRRAGDQLYAILYRDGYLGTIGLPELGTGSYNAGFIPEPVIDFLGMFPDIRRHHAFDELFLELLEAYTGRLRYISSVKLPGAGKGPTPRADYEVQKIQNAASRFRSTRSFEDFAAAMRQANTGREELIRLRVPNFDAAQALVDIMPRVMSTSDSEIKERFRKIMRAHTAFTGDTEELGELISELNALRRYMKSAERSSLAPYLMSDTMLFIRNYNSTSDTPLEIVLPDTTQADEYYKALKMQVSRHRTRLTSLGITEDDGRRIRQDKNS